MIYPLKRQTICTLSRARKVTITLAVIACVMYTFALWTSGIMDYGKHTQCVPYPQYKQIITTANNIDTVITLIIPSVMIFVMNIRIAYTISKFYDKRDGLAKFQFRSQFPSGHYRYPRNGSHLRTSSRSEPQNKNINSKIQIKVS